MGHFEEKHPGCSQQPGAENETDPATINSASVNGQSHTDSRQRIWIPFNRLSLGRSDHVDCTDCLKVRQAEADFLLEIQSIGGNDVLEAN